MELIDLLRQENNESHRRKNLSDEGPRAFISHASEDKMRFVIPFAESLRANGIDAWVDLWEIGPGDSLVQRIFDEGIQEADAFIVVLSHISVVKPWVREELDASVVRRINSGHSKRLIPVVLDEGVDVPAPLQHLLWESVPRHGLSGVTERVADMLLGRSRKPALGPKPAYVRTVTRLTKDPADETVLMLIAEKIRSIDSRHAWDLSSEEIQEKAQEIGISSERFSESMHSLVKMGLIDATVTLGGVRWLIRQFPDPVWLRLEQDRGVDVDAARKGLLASIVNDPRSELEPGRFEVGWITLYALLRELKSEGLIAYSVYNEGIAIHQVSPLAQRALREEG